VVETDANRPGAASADFYVTGGTDYCTFLRD
jgi:hypothetical protein